VVLGPDHPLVCATEALDGVIKQWVVVAALLGGSVLAYLGGRAWAGALALGAGVVLVILTLVGASVRQRKRDCAIDLILEGREIVGIPAVRRERERLLSARTRRVLARRFEEMVELTTRPQRLQIRGSRPLYHVSVVAEAIAELREVVGLLETNAALARGVARAERVITHGAYPLYGWDAGALRAELRRVRDQLGG
jgi:hypothetical protein